MSEPQYCECRHILPSGLKCQSPALLGKPLCYFHSRQRTLIDHNRYRQRSVELPPLEDRSAIQMAVGEVLSAMSACKIDRHTAGLYLFGLQIASQNLARATSLASPQAVNLFKEESGDVLAPAESVEPATAELAPVQQPQPDRFPLHLDDANVCATHEYDPEPPDIRTPSKAAQKILNDIKVGLEVSLAALSYKEEAQKSTQPPQKPAPETSPPTPGATISRVA